MAVKKLILDDFIDDVDYTLIAVHCSIEGYRLAYFLNKKLGLNLKRKREDIDLNTLAKYPIFEWEDIKQQVTWHLVSNVCRIEEVIQPQENTLFHSQATRQNTFYLIPEYKRVNYFLKINDDGLLSKNSKKTLSNIQEIPHIITAYNVDVDTIKSKNNLIFY